MATAKQVELFTRLTTDRDFGDKDVDQLRATFAGLSDSNASAWIERALELPKRDDSGKPFVAPSF